MHRKKRVRYLFHQYVHDLATRPELEEFFHLVRDASSNEELAGHIKELYDELKRTHPSLSYVDEQGKLNLPTLPSKIGTSIRLYAAFAAAVLLLVSAVIFLRPGPGHTNKARYEEVIKMAAKDENKYVLLSDSTKIWINSSSKLEYPERFDGETREINLEGEAYFEVKHADKVPFIIHTGDITTTVLGTSFNIKAYPDMDRVVVAVKLGKVKISKRSQVLATLVKNQEFSVTTKLPEAHTEERILSTKIAGNWKDGYLDYEDEPIEMVVKDLKRIYGAHVTLADSSLKQERITISFLRSAGASSVLNILCKLTDKKLTKQDSIYIIH
ncbi:FecR family protein [bacterium A37T11]|nr:FecR family protein [bacterium A37T11]